MTPARRMALGEGLKYRALYTLKKRPRFFVWWNDGCDTYRVDNYERCNNCRRSFHSDGATDTLPHYCGRCRREVNSAFRAKWWDDEEEVPF